MARPRSDIRPRLLHAARGRFLAEGVDGASLRDIARDAKTNVGMVVYYFPTKDELFLAVVEEVYAKLLAELTQAMRDPTTTRDRLGAAFARLGAADTREIEVIRLVLREALLVPPSPRFAKLLARFREGHISMLMLALAEGVQSGELDGAAPLPLLMLSTIAMGAVPQIVRIVAGDELPFSALPSPDVLAKASLDLLFRGIGKTAPPAAEGESPRKAPKPPKEKAHTKRSRRRP